MASSELVIDDYKLETQFFDNYVQHTTYHSDTSREEPLVKVVETWHRLEELGRGGYGTVFLERSGTGESRAVKDVAKDKNSTVKIDYRRELMAMAVLGKHDDFFVKFLGWYEDEHYVYIAMEYINHGNLRHYMEVERSESEAKVIIRQLMGGLVVMHQERFAHRDLKPENIFVVSKSPIWVKIGDFGLAKLARTGTAFSTARGTLNYIAPEVVLGNKDDTSKCINAVDIWAIGYIAHELLTRVRPFRDLKELISYYSHPEFPREAMLSKNISQEGIEFVESTLAYPPERRIAAKEALDSGWLRPPPLPSPPAQKPEGYDFGEYDPINGHEQERAHESLNRNSEALALQPARSHDERGRDREISSPPGTREERLAWHRVREIARGAFGTVFLERSEKGDFRAVKDIPKDKNSRIKIDYRRELMAMAVLEKHDDFFVKFLGWNEDEHYIHIAMEYISHGDLRHYMEVERSESEAKVIIRQLMRGLVAMHQERLAHRDLNPESIFVVSKSPIWVKIGSFGLAKLARTGTAFRTGLFSPGYTAPEMVMRYQDDTLEYTNAIDIWSVGCIAHELLTRFLPFRGFKELISYYYRPESPRGFMVSKNISQEGIEFVESTLAYHPERRIAAEEALGSKWLRQTHISLTLPLSPTELRPSQNMSESGGAPWGRNKQKPFTHEEISRKFKDYIEKERPGLKRFYNWETKNESDRWLKDSVTRGLDMTQKLMDRDCPRDIAMSLSLLALYDLVMLIDDSISMGFGEGGARVKTLSDTLKAASKVYSLAEKGGITAVRFLDTSNYYSKVTPGEIDAIMKKIVFEGVTNIGKKLLSEVLVNHVTPDMKKPLLLIVLTDAGIDREVTGLLKDVIVSQAAKLKQDYGDYGPQAVAYQFAKIGNDKAAQEGLRDDRILGSYIDCMGGRKERLEDLPKDRWRILPKLLLGAISSHWNTEATLSNDILEGWVAELEPQSPDDDGLEDGYAGDDFLGRGKNGPGGSGEADQWEFVQ